MIVDLKPDNTVVRLKRARLELGFGNVDRCLSDVEGVLERHGGDIEALGLVCFFLMIGFFDGM